jgi:predicted ATPase
LITKVRVENFKRFGREEFELEDSIVLAGPNNSGKSTLLQALATWAMALDRWRQGKRSTGKAKQRAGTPLTRRDFTALPLREFDLLWNDRRTALARDELSSEQKPGEPRLIHISVTGSQISPPKAAWSLTMELRYQGPEQIYVKPIPSESDLPAEALALSIVHCPPFSGIGSEERRLDRGAQNLEIGRGKPGDIIRNLLLEVSTNPNDWKSLVTDIEELFRVRICEPVYDESLTPFILCEYLPGIPKGKGKNGLSALDIASGGSGLLQVLILLSYFYARPASVLLLDEPDAHLHVILQRQIYDRLRQVASKRKCQLIVATHSEVILDGTSPSRIISFLGEPHKLVRDDQRDQVREAMKRLTTLDLLLAEQGRRILYCEGESDFKILKAWARITKHPALKFFENPFFHSNEGRNPREAREHLFALRAIHPSLQGLLLLDGDNRNLSDHEITGAGLSIHRWKRYEIENYLLVPDAIKRFLLDEPGDLFSSAEADAAIEYLRTQLPPQTFENSLIDNSTVTAVRASKDLLPQMFEAISHPLEREDYFLIAEAMKPEEIHPEVILVLEAIAGLAADGDAQSPEP